MLRPFCIVRSYCQLLTFSGCRWSAKLNKQLYDRWTWSIDHLKTVVARARRITICIDVWSKPNLSTSYLGISAFFFDPFSHTSTKAMRVKGFIMSLALHYWMRDAHHCSAPPSPSPKWPILCWGDVKLYYTIPYHTSSKHIVLNITDSVLK